jgi:hypothetical protein
LNFKKSIEHNTFSIIPGPKQQNSALKHSDYENISLYCKYLSRVQNNEFLVRTYPYYTITFPLPE